MKTLSVATFACGLLLACGGDAATHTTDPADTVGADTTAPADTVATPDTADPSSDTAAPADTRPPEDTTPSDPGPVPGTTLIISEYVEGSGENKAIEVFNPTLRTLNLNHYALWIGDDGAPWPGKVVPLYSPPLAPGEARVFVNSGADQVLLDTTDYLGHESELSFNGDDAVALAWQPPGQEGQVVDAIGVGGLDPGQSFAAAGDHGATKDHVLRRKPGALVGDPTWYVSAGTNADDSQWVVLPGDAYGDLGTPQICDGMEAFTCAGVGAECGVRRPPCGEVLDCGGCDGDVACGNNVCGGPFQMLVDAQRGEEGSAPEHFAFLDGVAYFAADDTDVGVELWRSDGTPAGTEVVRDIYAHTSKDAAPHELVVMGNALYFAATGDESGCAELWKTHGDASTTTELSDGCAAPEQLTGAGGRLFFRGAGDYGPVLWVCNGTSAGTRIVRDTYGYEVALPTGLAAWDDTVLFGVSDTSGIQQLWRSDGSASGTRRVVDFDTYHDDAVGIFDIARLGDLALFGAWWPEHGRELVVSDLTPGGTQMVTDLTPGISYASVPASTNPHDLHVHGDVVYFVGDDSSSSGLFRSDGTSAGSARIALGEHESPGELASVGDALFFTTTRGLRVIAGDGPAVDLGTPPGALFDLTAAGDTLYFLVGDLYYPRALWRSDGTSAGTVPVEEATVGGKGVTRILGYGDGDLFVVADDGVHGEEPWVLRLSD